MGKYKEVSCVKTIKSNGKILSLDTARAVIEHLKRRDYLSVKSVTFIGRYKLFPYTYSGLVVDTQFSTYAISFDTIGTGIKFALKHDLADADKILTGTIPDLRPYAMNIIERYTKRTLKRQIAKTLKHTKEIPCNPLSLEKVPRKLFLRKRNLL